MRNLQKFINVMAVAALFFSVAALVSGIFAYGQSHSATPGFLI
jgi:uncharacterized membrane-anchored protein